MPELWSTEPSSVESARLLIDDSDRKRGDMAYELALHGLSRPGNSCAHRVLSAAFLNIYDEVLTLRVAGPIQVE
jgi:hypothetical protein